MKLLNEDYLDNVPDMSGPSPFKSDGTRKDDWFLIRIPAEKVGQKERRHQDCLGGRYQGL